MLAGCSASTGHPAATKAATSTPDTTTLASSTTLTTISTRPTSTRPTCPGPPDTFPKGDGQDVVVVSVPCDCPTQPVTPAPSTDNPSESAVKAATAWLKRLSRQWAKAVIRLDAVYKVGDTTKGQFASVFARNVPMFCGAKVAAASYGVELINPTEDDTGYEGDVVVAHFAHGWEVWGSYHP